MRSRTESTWSSFSAVITTKARGGFVERVFMSEVMRPRLVRLKDERTICSRSLVCFSHFWREEFGAKSSTIHIIDLEIAFSIHAIESIAEPGRRSLVHVSPRDCQNCAIDAASQDLPERRPPAM